MLPAPGELLHFSEDPSIHDFVPHVVATAQQPEAYVWAVDVLNSPCYWFPRQCPRVCSWSAVSPLGPPEEVGDLVGLHAEHGIELRVLPELQTYFAGVRDRGLEFSGIRMGCRHRSRRSVPDPPLTPGQPGIAEQALRAGWSRAALRRRDRGVPRLRHLRRR